MKGIYAGGEIVKALLSLQFIILQIYNSKEEWQLSKKYEGIITGYLVGNANLDF
ncbi:MAG: hypothetical protein O8C62_11515 [Candidatus Methanoperedens sp.]|nr:hypothetical protein [Candidatus Methanoperedens sp.]